MPTEVTVRAEQHRDFAAIGQVIRAAFAGMPYADGNEAELVDTLRRADALCVSLVAELAGSLVGHVAFSPATSSDGSPGWYALGPVAVLPAHQGDGIGSKLVRTGLDAILAKGATGCILVGNPAYYTRFGFELAPFNAPADEPAKFFMLKLLLGPRRPSGPISFHRAFRDPSGSTE